MLMHSKESRSAIISSIQNKIALVNAENMKKFNPTIKLPKASLNTRPCLEDFSVIDPEGFYKKKMQIRHGKSCITTLPEVACPANLIPTSMNYLSSR